MVWLGPAYNVPYTLLADSAVRIFCAAVQPGSWLETFIGLVAVYVNFPAPDERFECSPLIGPTRTSMKELMGARSAEVTGLVLPVLLAYVSDSISISKSVLFPALSRMVYIAPLTFPSLSYFKAMVNL